MTWAPTKQVIDVTQIITNLLTFIDAHQADALAWASGTPDLAPFAKLYPSASGRLASLYPQLMVIDQEDEGEDAETENGDVLLTGFRLRLEGAITGADADTLALTAKQYDLAVKSMLINVTGLTDGSNQTIHVFPVQIGTKFDVVSRLKSASFIQVWQTTVIYKLITNAF